MTESQTKHSANCLLRTPCRLADTSACTPRCPAYIAMHGTDGKGGRSASANVPRDYRLVTVDGAPCREDQAAVYRNIDAYVKTFDRQFADGGERIKSLYLYSESPGTGKTTTASAVLNEWLIRHYVGSITRGRQPAQMPAYFLDVNHFQTVYNRMVMAVGDVAKKPFADEFNRMIDRSMRTQFVVMDDIGVRDATDAFRAYVHDVINHRVSEQMPTVYTSNVPLEHLRNIYDARLADRVGDMCAELRFKGESKRGMR